MNHDTGQTFYTLTFREGPTLNYDYDEMIEIEGIDEFDD
jgi:glutamine cyclotransferase